MSGGVEGKLRDVLVRIRRAWPRQDEPRVTERSRQVPGPRVPLPAGWLTRDTVAGDLDYWADVAENNGVTPYRDGRDVIATAGHLLANVDALAAWEWAPELLHDLARGARLLEELTSPPRPAVLLGPCPVEVVDEDGTRRPCGTDVRADTERASDVRCPGCLTVDTAEGWARRMGAASGPVTAEVLAKRLLAVGVRTTATGVRMRSMRGSLPNPVGYDTRGRALYDPTACLAAVVNRQTRRAAASD